MLRGRNRLAGGFDAGRSSAASARSIDARRPLSPDGRLSAARGDRRRSARDPTAEFIAPTLMIAPR